MVDINSKTEQVHVNVSSVGNKGNVSFAPTQSYYDGLAKKWAVSDELVNGEDYSSKYYANESKKQADLATENATIATNKVDEVVESGNEVLSKISAQEIASRNAVKTEGDTQVARVQAEGANYATKAEAKYTAGEGISIENNVISSTGADLKNKLAVQNMFTTGTVSTDTQGYNQLLEMKNSGKAKIDIIKPDNYTVVGSPTITDDDIASGFTTANKINTLHISQLKNKSWTIETIFQANENNAPIPLFCIADKVPSGGIGYSFANKGFTFQGCFGDSTTVINAGTLSAELTNGINYKIKLSFDYSKGQYTWSYGLADGDYISSKTYTPTTADKQLYDIINDTDKYVEISGVFGGWTGVFPIDLNSFKIYVDGNLVYQSCLKIPYVLSKTGSKIVDVAYRTRVQDLYEQTGTASYYTIDETNQNFTLPMGEIYGMIEQKADNDKLNNPFTFGMSRYFKGEMKNLSWLKSNGQEYFKAGHPDFYNWVLENANNGVKDFVTTNMYYFENATQSLCYCLTTQKAKIGQAVYGLNTGFKGYVEEVTSDGFKFTVADKGLIEFTTATNSYTHNPTDYDFVVNDENKIFIPPLLDGSESLSGDNCQSVTSELTKISDSEYSYVLPKNGSFTVLLTNSSTSYYVNARNTTTNERQECRGVGTPAASVEGKRGQKILIHHNAEASIGNAYFSPFVGNGNLYYYVGETVQNENIINAGEVWEELSNKADVSTVESVNTKAETKMGKPNYSAGWSITLPYTCTQDGWAYAGVNGVDSVRYVYVNGQKVHGHCGYSGGKSVYSGSVFPVCKGDKITCDKTSQSYYFYPQK